MCMRLRARREQGGNSVRDGVKRLRSLCGRGIEDPFAARVHDHIRCCNQRVHVRPCEWLFAHVSPEWSRSPSKKHRPGAFTRRNQGASCSEPSSGISKSEYATAFGAPYRCGFPNLRLFGSWAHSPTPCRAGSDDSPSDGADGGVTIGGAACPGATYFSERKASAKSTAATNRATTSAPAIYTHRGRCGREASISL